MFYDSISGSDIHRGVFAAGLSAWCGRTTLSGGGMRIYEPFQATLISLRMEKPCLKSSFIYILSGLERSSQADNLAWECRRGGALLTRPSEEFSVLICLGWLEWQLHWMLIRLGTLACFPRLQREGILFLRIECPLHPVENRFCSVVFEIMRCVTIRVYSAANITYVGTVIFQLS